MNAFQIVFPMSRRRGSSKGLLSLVMSFGPRCVWNRDERPQRGRVCARLRVRVLLVRGAAALPTRGL